MEKKSKEKLKKILIFLGIVLSCCIAVMYYQSTQTTIALDDYQQLYENKKISGEKAVQLFLAKGFQLDDVDDRGRTFLTVAAQGGDYETVKFLLNRNKELAVNDVYALDFAIQNNHNRIAKLLIANGADAKYDELLFSAICNTEMFNLLIDEGANPNDKDFMNRPLIFWIMDLRYRKFDRFRCLTPEISYSHLKKLVTNGVDVNTWIDANFPIYFPSPIQFQTNYTPLMLAASQGDQKIVSLLLDNGADINLTDTRVRTALKYAANANQVNMVDFLLKKGAK